ncbi:MAG: hypothetical protein AAFY42_11900 [Pseudomonadota bacterium]
MPWRGPLGGDPLESLPGPSNPWLACSGDSSQRPSEPGAGDPQLPHFVMPEEGAVHIDWNKISVGMNLAVSGTLVTISALVGAFAMAANLPAPTAGAPAGAAVSVVGSYLAAGGVILMGAGGATMIGGIDPKISDYKKHVPAVPTRKLALSGDLPAPVVPFMLAVAEIERLSTAETDIIDHARAAAKADDKSWTELHLRDLYHVQNAKQHYVGLLAGALAAINEAFGKDFDQHWIDPEEPVRDLINPLIEMRGTLIEVAGIGSAEVNSVLATVRMPSPLSDALEASVHAFASEVEGQPSAIVGKAVDQLERLDVIDREAFGLGG